jgi:DNA-binding CsgD family transcriptional regulator/tetratricopeptide (TPR) repeat protein
MSNDALDHIEPDLIGREAESAAIDAIISGALADRVGAALLITGEPGIGKSALLRSVITGTPSIRVLRIIGGAQGNSMPFAGLHGVLHPLRHLVHNLPAVQRRAVEAALGVRDPDGHTALGLATGVFALLVEAARAGALLVAVDDLQWLDAQSADALAFAARHLAAAPSTPQAVILLLTARPDPATAARLRGVPVLEVVGLPPPACESLVTAVAGRAVSTTAAAELCALTGGNPAALAELSGALTAEQLAGHDPLPDPLPAGPALIARHASELARLPDTLRRLLLIAAVGRGLDAETILSATRLAGIGMPVVEQAEAAGLLVFTANTVRFPRPVLAMVVPEYAGAAARRAAHAALAAALADPHEAERRAWHRAEACIGVDDHVADELEATAPRARQRGGHDAAAKALRRSAELTTDPDRRARRFAAAARDSWASGQPADAVAMLESADRYATSTPRRGEVVALRGEIELRSGGAVDARLTLLNAAGLLDNGMAVLDTLHAAADCIWYSGDLAAITEVWRSAARLGPFPPNTRQRLSFDMLRGLVAMAEGRQAEGVGLLRSAATANDVLDDPRSLLRAGFAAQICGDDALAHAMARRAVVVVRATGAGVVLPTALARLVDTEIHTGAHAAAQRHAAEGLRTARQTGQVNVAGHLQAHLAVLAALRGDLDDCRRHAEPALELATANKIGLVRAMVSHAYALYDLSVGDPAGATERLRHIAGTGPGTGHPTIWMLTLPLRIEAAATRHPGPPRPGVLAVLSVFTDWADATGCGWAQALVSRSRALLADGPEAHKHFQEALRLHADDRRPFDQARTQLLFGQLLRRQRRRGEARIHLRDAAETFGQLSARLWEARARSELRAAGDDSGAGEGMHGSDRSGVAARPGGGRPTGSRGTAGRGPDGRTREPLTSQELAIVRLVAAGATNREVAARMYLSARTVEYHLRKVFAKLGVSSRVELSRLAAGGEIQSAEGPPPAHQADAS